MELGISGRAAVITGASGALGRAVAYGMAAEGANVVLLGQGEALLEQAAEQIRQRYGVQALALPTDTSSTDQAAAVAAQQFGALHILVNNAGIGASYGNKMALVNPPKVWEIDPKLWDKTLSVNAAGPFLMIRAALPEMRRRKWGRVIGITTSLDNMLRAGQTAYGASKAAHEALMAMLAQDLQGSGVTANVLVPGGPADTRMVPAVKGWTDRSKLIQPEQMVPPLLYICSAAADSVNGRRFVAARWNAKSSPAANARRDDAPIGWTGQKAIMPH